MISIYRLIVSDLDESLLNDEGKISPADQNTIRQLIARGVKFVPNTGRGFASVQPLLQKIGTYQKDQQFVISYNGGVIVNNYHNDVLISHLLPFALADQLYQLARQHDDLCIHIYTVHEVYIANITPEERAYIKSRGVKALPFEEATLKQLQNQPIVKIIMENLDQSRLTAFYKEVQAAVPEPLAVTYSSNRYIEFNPPQVSKGQATEELAQRLKIPISDVIALGDNSNDLSMIKQAGLGISVQNGTDEVKQAAQTVLKASNNQNPLTEIAERFF